MNFILPAEFITSPLLAAANLIGVITSDKALTNAKNYFPNWQIAAHKCAAIVSAHVCANFDHNNRHGVQEQRHP